MKPRGPLMTEHRLIEKMLAVVKDQIAIIDKEQGVDPLFVDTAVDFIRTYADTTHHGKEEEILFRDLARKIMNPDDQKAMEELVEEHKYARQIVAELVQAKEDYIEGRQGALETIKQKLNTLVEFYPDHITKEDKVFFPNTEKYLSEEEQEGMLQQFWEFDRMMIHEKYKSVVERLALRRKT
jgi:hemerythrin-like domain-containing protein